MKVLVVDDSALMRRAIGGMLSAESDIEVCTARNGQHALEVLDDVQPDVVTLDVNMPVMDGITCLSKIMSTSPRPVVMISSLTEKGALVTLEALELGAVDYVAKPGGTVSTNMAEVAEQVVSTVRRAARSRVRRAGGLTARIRAQREHVAARPLPPRRGTGGRAGRDSTVELVLVGASTGGPGLLTDLVSQLPAEFRAPVLIAQHIPASFTGPLARRMNDASALRVVEVTATTTLEPSTVYLARGDADVVVARRPDGLVARSVPAGSGYRWHPSVDRLVHSALQVCQAERLVGVQLTGMGDDGAEQMAAVHAGGGRTVAESEDSAVVWGMPGELVRRGGATRVLPAEEIVPQVLAWV